MNTRETTPANGVSSHGETTPAAENAAVAVAVVVAVVTATLEIDDRDRDTRLPQAPNEADYKAQFPAHTTRNKSSERHHEDRTEQQPQSPRVVLDKDANYHPIELPPPLDDDDDDYKALFPRRAHAQPRQHNEPPPPPPVAVVAATVRASDSSGKQQASPNTEPPSVLYKDQVGPHRKTTTRALCTAVPMSAISELTNEDSHYHSQHLDEEAIAVPQEKSNSAGLASAQAVPYQHHADNYSNYAVPVAAALLSDKNQELLLANRKNRKQDQSGGTASTSVPTSDIVHSAKSTVTCSKRRLVVTTVVLVCIVVGVVLLGSLLGTRPNRHSDNPSPAARTDPPNQDHESSRPLSFTSTLELYNAVDAYLNATTAASDDADVAASVVARTYGHPIGTWDVSRLTDFSRVFDPDRYQPLDDMLSNGINNSTRTCRVGTCRAPPPCTACLPTLGISIKICRRGTFRP
jgi:hypothetical protein